MEKSSPINSNESKNKVTGSVIKSKGEIKEEANIRNC
jgi:hypothetical protein